MIVAHRKSIPELIEILTGHNNVLVLGCGTCVTVCLAGGQREVGIIASALRMASRLRGHVVLWLLKCCPIALPFAVGFAQAM